MQDRLKLLNYIQQFKPYESIEHPVLLNTVRRLGYKANKHFTVIGKIKKGNKAHHRVKKGRSNKSYYCYYSSRLSGLAIAKQRTQKKHAGHEIINGYYLCHHNGYNFYQIIVA